MMKLVLVARMW